MAFSLAPLLKGSAVCSAKSTQLGCCDNVESFPSAQHRERGFSCAKDLVGLRPLKWTDTQAVGGTQDLPVLSLDFFSSFGFVESRRLDDHASDLR